VKKIETMSTSRIAAGPAIPNTMRKAKAITPMKAPIM
jgi:hypothetical protein